VLIADRSYIQRGFMYFFFEIVISGLRYGIVFQADFDFYVNMLLQSSGLKEWHEESFGQILQRRSPLKPTEGERKFAQSRLV
jgi:hypothetical protein